MLALVLLAANIASADPLLSKAFSHADAVDKLRVGLVFTVETRLENLDSKGAVKSVDETVAEVTVGDGTESRRVVRATKAGHVLDADEREELKGNDAIGKKFSLESPFRAKNRNRQRFTVGGLDADGLVRVAFEPLGDTDTHVNVGVAYVDPATGAPRRIELHPSDLPIYLERLDTTITFDASTPNALLPKSITSDATGGMLFVKRSVHTVTTFSVVTKVAEK